MMKMEYLVHTDIINNNNNNDNNIRKTEIINLTRFDKNLTLMVFQDQHQM